MKGVWVPHDVRDQIVDYVNYWKDRSGISSKQIVAWIGCGSSKFYDWKSRYGKANEHNGQVPRDFWIEDWEKRAILDFHAKNSLEGYRRLAFMMLDADVVAVSPSSVYRVLREAGVLDRFHRSPSKKGTGFVQPLAAHDHWHIDVSYLNIAGTFYYLCSVLDGYSRAIVHWEIREQMKETDVEIILQRAREEYPDATPRPHRAANHQRQRTAVRVAWFQGVHSHHGDDTRSYECLLPTEQRQARTFSSHDQRRLHSRECDCDARRCSSHRG